MAVDELYLGSKSQAVLDLAILHKSETRDAETLSKILGSDLPVYDDGEVARKWLYIVLSWLFENRSDVADPLKEVETVYADFNYPKEIESFVRYMPTQGGYDTTMCSPEDNYARLKLNWETYLSQMECEFGAK